ncbi:MAG TPA: nucleotidyltransferase [Pyrinomonadaceae bacterium]|nr:nucleotidyltransferase [Pyrinomonadaceae bacterium]
MNLEEDLREFIELLNALDVRYILVGAHVVAYHGYPRFTGDIDLFVEMSEENAERILNVIKRFGFEGLGLDFLKEDQVVQLGVDPNRIDLMTFLSGVDFQEAWATREQAEIDGLKMPIISKEMLKRNKAASGRIQDLADLEQL